MFHSTKKYIFYLTVQNCYFLWFRGTDNLILTTSQISQTKCFSWYHILSNHFNVCFHLSVIYCIQEIVIVNNWGISSKYQPLLFTGVLDTCQTTFVNAKQSHHDSFSNENLSDTVLTAGLSNDFPWRRRPCKMMNRSHVQCESLRRCVIFVIFLFIMYKNIVLRLYCQGRTHQFIL